MTAFDYQSAVLDRLEEPVLIVDQQRRVLFCNAQARRIAGARIGWAIQNGRLTCSNASADAALDGALLASASSAGHVSRALRVPRRSAAADWLGIVTILREPESGPGCIFLVRMVGRLAPRTLSAQILKDLYSLTPREIQVLQHLMRHRSMPETAERMALSRETVRGYVKRIMRKCEVRTQADLLSLLQRLSSFAT